jgi:putative copper export protein
VNGGFRIGAKLWWGFPVLFVLLWVAGAFAIEVFPGLASTPLGTVWLLPFIRFTRDIAAAITVGAVVVGALLGGVYYRRVLRWASAWAFIWLVSLTVLMALTISNIFAASPMAAMQPNIWVSFLVDVSIGRVFLYQFVAVALVAGFSLFIKSRISGWVIAAIAISACAAPALLGHGGVHDSHLSETISLGIHIAAISLWVGGLAVLVYFLGLEPERGSLLIPRFSLLALWCVIFVAESGLLNSALHLGDVSQFVGTFYGVLVLTKVVLLGVLVRIGWLQRRKVVARIAAEKPPRSLLARYAAWELVVMGSAIAVSVVMSRIGISPARTATGEFLPPAVVILALAAPLVLVWAFPRGHLLEQSWLGWLMKFPQLSAVLLLVVVAEVAGVGVLSTLLGPELGVILGTLLLVAAGYLWAASVVGTSTVVGIVIPMVGWPPVILLISLLATDPVGWKTNLLSIVVAEALLIWVWFRRPTRVDSLDTSGATVAG